MNYFLRNMLIGMVLTLVLSTIAVAGGDLTEQDKESIKKIKETYRISWLKNDKKTILAQFASDAAIYPNGLDPRHGIEQISEFWFSIGPTETVIDEYEIVIEEISGEKNQAFAVGSSIIKWTTTDKTSKEVWRYSSKGNFLTVFARRQGEWKIVKHIWNGKFKEIGK